MSSPRRRGGSGSDGDSGSDGGSGGGRQRRSGGRRVAGSHEQQRSLLADAETYELGPASPSHAGAGGGRGRAASFLPLDLEPESERPLPASSPPAFAALPSPPSVRDDADDDNGDAALGLARGRGGSGSSLRGARASSSSAAAADRYDGSDDDFDGDGGNEDGRFSQKTIWRQRLRELGSLASWSYFARHAMREASKRKCNFALGLFSCFLVVVIAATCFTLIARAPVVFLQQAETAATQTDLVLTPSVSVQDEPSGSPFLNFTTLQHNLAVSPEFELAAPRTQVDAYIFPAVSCPPGLDVWDNTTGWQYVGLPTGSASNNPALANVSTPTCNNASLTCLDSLCTLTPPGRRPTSSGDSVPFVALDTLRERSMGLGRLWPYKPLSKGEVLITADVASAWRLKRGDTVTLKFARDAGDWNNRYSSTFVHPFAKMLRSTVARGVQAAEAGWFGSTLFPSTSGGLDANSTFVLDAALSWYSRALFVPFRVAGVLERSWGKFLSDTDALLIAESRTLLQHVLDFAHPILAQTRSVEEIADIMLVDDHARFFPGLRETISSSRESHSFTVLPVPLVEFPLHFAFLQPRSRFDGRLRDGGALQPP